MNLKRVVVTGLGALTPIGNNISEYWNSLLAGVSGAGPITRFDASKLKTHFACEVKGFQPADHFDRKEARKYDLYSQYAIVAAREAIKDANLALDTEDKDRIGVILGIGIGGIQSLEKEIMDYATGDGTPRYSPFFITKMIANMASGHIAMEYGFRGPNYICSSACASSTTAIASAIDQIRLGRVNVMVTGGAEAPLTISGMGGFNSMHALSTRNDDPQTASRPFCKSRDGFVMGEGAGCLVLEELEHALSRGATIYAEIAGVGASADAHHITASHPEGLGAILAMKHALEDANMSIEDIDYINVHGTSTPVGDVSEAKAIVKLFGEHAYRLNISSTKSMTGHLMGAAGAVEGIASILSVYHDVVPPTINYTGEEDENIDYRLNFTFNQAQKRTVNAALSNTFGFGGQNASLIVKKFNQ
ncbi:MAG: beta-ketoacyl-ACP synthase II [Paludibacteraceae bacterium]|jgi:3-oxoacyl-[acyl-carrier-protein] synthase II|nr:beta-ketoacyl-ACP synthase II [Paludibacteraceae bacterium]MEE1174669.1 beta-ketoacyl-ACP synthase II [Paludibacteraceae bacterium]